MTIEEQDALTANRKLDELLGIIDAGNLNNEQKMSIRKRFNDATAEPEVKESEVFKSFKDIGEGNESRFDVADDLEFLLSKHQLDSNLAKRYLLMENTKRIVQLVISILLIIMGFSMIFIPAPPYFEMFTIYYFTRNDGVTLMDLISLLIVFSGIYLLISSLINLRRSES